MQVSKWGNSLAVRLPTSVVEALELKEGDDIEIHAAGARTFLVSRPIDRPCSSACAPSEAAAVGTANLPALEVAAGQSITDAPS
jgi:antitoxin component of MazEF toxin-antitoxin module